MGGLQLHHTFVEADTGIGIGGGIKALFFIENVGLPVGELRCFGNAPAEEVGKEFGQTHVLNAHRGGHLLEVYAASRCEVGAALAELVEVVFEREAHFAKVFVLEKLRKAVGEAHEVETKEETKVAARHLQQRHLVGGAAAEGGARFGVDAQQRAGAEVAHSAFGFGFALHHNDAAGEGVARQCGNELFIGLGEEF